MPTPSKPKASLQHLEHGRRGMGGAAGVGDDPVLVQVEQVAIEGMDHREIGIGAGGGDDDMGDGPLQVPGRTGAVREAAGGLHHQLRAALGKGDVPGVGLMEERVFPALDVQVVPAVPGEAVHGRVVVPVDGIEPQEMDDRLQVGGVVEGAEQLRAHDREPPHRDPSDPAQPIDGDQRRSLLDRADGCTWREILQAGRVAELVVVPAEDLDVAGRHDLRQEGIEDAAGAGSP